MKARIAPQLSAKEQRALTEEIRRQCVDATKEYECDIDTAWIYALHEIGFGRKRLEQLYRSVFRYRKEIQAYYSGERNDNMAETAMRHKLMQYGIDVKKMYERENDGRFVVTISDHEKRK